jgi:hypothetical protein
MTGSATFSSAARKSCAAAAAVVMFSMTTLPAQERVNPRAEAVNEFNKRVRAYLDLHNKEKGQVPAAKVKATPEEVLVFEKALGERIRAARAGTGQGDVFLPPAADVFKQIFTDYYKRRTGRELHLLFDEVPNFKPQINMSYPANAPKANFPPRLGLALPTLPDTLEYRLVGNYLILRDAEANIIVDYIPNALPIAGKPKS